MQSPSKSKTAADFLTQLIHHRWAWRLLLTLAFIVPVLLVLPHARSLVVRNAVITAYLGDIKAPIDGGIESINQPIGTMAREAEPALLIHNDRISRSQLARLEVRRDEAERAAAEVRRSLEAVRAMAAARRAEQQAFVEAIALELSRKLAQAEEDKAARAADLKSAAGNRERAFNLHAQGLLSPAELETADASYERAAAAVSANQLIRKRLAQQLTEIRNNVFQIEESDGILLTRQLVQQLELEVVKLELALQESGTEWKALVAETAAAAVAYQRSAQAGMMLQPGLTIWNIYVTRGAWVTAGTVLLSVVDCSNLMADVAVDDATLELIAPGQKVRLRLFGTFDHVSGHVIQVRGSAGLGDTPVLASEVQNRTGRMGRVLVKIDEMPAEASPAKSCGIGRTAYAEFEGLSVFQTILYPLFR